VSIYSMIRELGFRRVLPVVFTALHFVALLTTSNPNPQPAAKPADPTVQLAAGQVEVPAFPLERKLSRGMKMALLENLPSLLLAAPLAVLLFQGSSEALLYAAGVFVPFAWYLIGRWIDGLLGLVKRRLMLSPSVSGAFALMSAGMFALSILTITPLNHHRGTDTYWAGAALILWTGIFLAMAVSSYYRNRAAGSQR
jgi:hypothetical protein